MIKLITLWQFARPHTIVGSTLSILSLFFIALGTVNTPLVAGLLLPLSLLAALALAPAAPAQTQAPAAPTAGNQAAPAIPAATSWEHDGSDIPADPAWVTGTLANGVRYAVRQNAIPGGTIAIRVRMEQMLADAAADGAKVLIVRAGDFFGPEPGNNWLSLGMVKAGRPIAAVTYPGPVGVAHTWAYLPDVALTMVRLAMLPDLAEFEVFHMRGHVLTGSEMARTLGEAAGRTLAISRLPWLAVRAASPFNESLREMLEMRYLWETPVLMNNAKLVARLGEEPHTPTVEALREALAGMGALPHRAILVAATAPGLMKSTPPTWPAYRRESQTW